MHWDHRTYGSVLDPIHKSHLVTITGDYGCPKRFWYDRNTPAGDVRATSGRAALGTATHEVIAELLSTGTIASLLEHDVTERLRWWVRQQEPVEWYDDDPAAELRERVAMVVGLMRRVDARVQRVIALEPGFIAQLGPHWISGHIDLVYEPVHHPGGIAMADWKTGAQKPHAIQLDHGWEAGLYSVALAGGLFVPRGGMTREALEADLIARARLTDGGFTPTYGQFPVDIHQVHLGDYVPYVKSTAKQVKRPEDLAHYGLLEPARHTCKPGDMRGGAWMRVRLGEHDVPRLAARLKAVVGMVRLGRFFDRPDEPCVRCPHRGPCLTDGYVPRDAATQRHLADLATLDTETPE